MNKIHKDALHHDGCITARRRSFRRRFKIALARIARNGGE